MAEKKSFVLYADCLQHLAFLNAEECGHLFLAILRYVDSGELPEFESALGMAFSFIRAQIDREQAKYDEKCEKNRENGKKGGRPPKPKESEDNPLEPTETERFLEKPKKPYPVPDPVPDPDPVPYPEPVPDPVKDIPSSPAGAGERIQCQGVVDSFNRICKSLPQVQKLTDSRRKAIKSASAALGVTTFDQLFAIVEGSDFLTGRTGSFTGCGFDWVLKPANLTKIIEGNYQNRGGSAAGRQHENFSDPSRYQNLTMDI